MATLRGKKRPAGVTGSVREALRLRFCPPAWAFLEEVGNGTGASCRRHADAVAMSLWPSRGLELHGVEIKVSRADWLSELRNPEKADEIAKYCDRWWLAVGSAEIVRPGELPASWGLLVLDGTRIVCKTEAPKLEVAPLDLKFFAALLRKVHEAQVRVQAEARAEGFERGQSLGPVEHQAERQALRALVDNTQKSIADFERESGLKIDTWNAGDIGNAVRKFMSLSSRWDPEPAQKLQDAAAVLERQAKELRAHAAKIEKQKAIVAKAAG